MATPTTFILGVFLLSSALCTATADGGGGDEVWQRTMWEGGPFLREIRLVCSSDPVCVGAFGSDADTDDDTFAYMVRQFDREAFEILLATVNPNDLTTRERVIILILSRLALQQAQLCDGGRRPFYDRRTVRMTCVCPPEVECDDRSPSIAMVKVVVGLTLTLIVVWTIEVAVRLRVDLLLFFRQTRLSKSVMDGVWLEISS